MNVVRAILKWVLIAVVVIVAVAYAGDYVSATYRMSRPKPGNPLEVSTVRRLYAIQQKSGKADISLGDPETEVCIQALFPHFGFQPCWYVHRQDKKPVILG